MDVIRAFLFSVFIDMKSQRAFFSHPFSVFAGEAVASCRQSNCICSATEAFVEKGLFLSKIIV